MWLYNECNFAVTWLCEYSGYILRNLAISVMWLYMNVVIRV